jgi:CRP/FNR family cyclic AMP-dependent transcriptional regulator
MDESEYLKNEFQLLEDFRHIPLFDSLDNEYLKQLLAVSKVRNYDAGETITEQGEFDPWMFSILGGEVSVEVDGEEVAFLSEPGQIFGEMVLITEDERTASVIAASAVTLLAVDCVLLLEFEKSEKDAFFSIFYKIFCRILASRLVTSNQEHALLKREFHIYRETC